MKTKILFYISLIAVAFTACNEEVFLEDHSGTTKNGLNIEIIDQYSGNTTRANYSGFPATTFEQGDSIGIYAFDGTSYVASNVKFVKQADGTWLSDEEVAYSDDMTYYAYFPYRSTTYTPSTAGTVNDIDTKFASFISDANNYFWKADQSTKDGYTYSNLMIAKGVVTMENDDPVVKFTMLHKRGLALFVDDAELVEFNGNLPYKIGNTVQFLMKPNVLTNFEYDNEACSLTASNGGYSTHKVVKWYYNLEITAPDDFTYSGGTKNYSVASYKTNKNNEIIPIAWTAQFSEDDGETWTDTPPAWLTAFTASDDGGTTAESYNATVTASQYLSGSATATAILHMKSAVTDVDLSDPTGIGTPQNTANCYVISAPGTYKIPLVYGNAIKNGSENSAAYSGCFTSKGESINTPYMKDNNQTPNGAEVVWKDNYNNMRNADLSIEGDYLHFIVRNTYAEGNVVIGIKENDDIIWTYHIWITPVDWSNTNATDIAGLAPTNVGWVNNGNLSYSGHQGRRCLVKFTQSEEGTLEKTITILQKEDMTVSGYSADGYCPYYQWGRFTPIIPSNNLSSLSSGTSYQHSAYNGNGTYVYNECDLINSNGSYVMTNKGEFISKPLIIWSVNTYSQTYYSSYMGETWKTNVKTVFDPCPVGMKVVNGSQLSGYFGSGKTWTKVDNTSMSITVSGKTLTLPVCGYITINGSYKQRALINSNKWCFYWPSNKGYMFDVRDSGTSYYRISESNYRNGTKAGSVRGFAE